MRMARPNAILLALSIYSSFSLERAYSLRISSKLLLMRLGWYRGSCIAIERRITELKTTTTVPVLAEHTRTILLALAS